MVVYTVTILFLKQTTMFKGLTSSSLIHHPQLWKGLPSNVIQQLYRARVIKLGKNYKPSKIELDSILSTAKSPLEAQIIYNSYISTEADVYKADADTDYDNYITEGEYMEDPLEPNGFDEYPSTAQDIVRDFRDLMEFNRKAAFELPKLSKYRQIYNNNEVTPFKYKYTKYLGESHPAESKVSVIIDIKKLNDLNNDSLHKLKLISGPRYNPINETITITSNRFLEPAQNASFISTIINDLINESKKDPQYFNDIPLDTRHIKEKPKPKFPDSWLNEYIPNQKIVD